VSESTIIRDIDYMRYDLHAPIKYDHARGGYYYTEKNYRLFAGSVTPDEMLTLGVVKSLLTLYKDTPLYATAQKLLDTLAFPFSNDSKSNSDKTNNTTSKTTTTTAWYETRVIVPAPASSPVPADLWDTIVTALRENRVLTFDYKGARDDSPHHRRVHPWQLLFDNGTWILSAWSTERDAHRFFDLYRMKRPALTDATFTLPANFDYRSQPNPSAFGVYSTEKARTFRIALYGEAIRYAKERHWAADQIFEEIDDGVAMSFTSNQYGKVLEWILARGGLARPIEPPKLVCDWRVHAEIIHHMARTI
jgi:predicted DNA-binding transcriptional regulator YafY